ncbi:hypothetical protein [Archangium lipolyticum]|uniref:hypothetical protein n=1 Tax=Archangium lipolyticum TaxID=2970465 RepID=UPI00214A0D5F|nr:hypothetical protein [Archangium lipolyticum]
MNLSDLRSELSASHHDGRVKRMVELGRRARDDARVRAQLDEMARGDTFERRLALVAQYSWREGGRVLHATSDESRLVRSLAFRLVALACDDVQALEALRMAYAMRRDDVLLRSLVQEGRHAVIDSYLDWLATRPGVHSFADVVPLASPEGLRRYLARALEKPSVRFWSRLARYAPDTLGAVLAERLRAVPGEADPVTRQLVDWSLDRIAEFVPDRALELFELLLSRRIHPDPGAWRYLVKQRPSEVMALLQRHGLDVPPELFSRVAHRLDAESLGWLVRRKPLALGDAGKLLEKLSESQRQAVTEAWCAAVDAGPAWGTALLERISEPATRDRVFTRWSIAQRNANGVIEIHVLAKLPAELQEREARRHLHEVVALGTRPAERMPYARFLPWDEALSALQGYIGHPEGGMRGAALATVLAIPGFRPAETALVDKALALVLARKNEQDPVRMAMLQALTRWPRRVWRREHTEAIGRMLRDALDAADLSYATAAAAETLLLRTFRLDPEWGAKWLGTLLKERGSIQNARLGVHLSDDDVRAAAPHLLAVARIWAERERGRPLLELAQSLGERAKLVPGMCELFAAVRDETPWSGLSLALTQWASLNDRERFESSLGGVLRRWYDRGWFNEILALVASEKADVPLHPELLAALERVVVRCLQLNNNLLRWALELLQHRSIRDFDRLLPELLARDESIVCLPVVHLHLHRRRQDLLGPFLGNRVITGHYATGRTRWLLPFHDGFFRWTPEQNTTYSRSLASLCADTDRDTPTVLWAVALLAALDYAPMDYLCSLAEDPRAAVQEKALRVMARCDQGQGVPTLLGCLGDARARIAIYGLRRAFAGMPPARVAALLAEAPMTKVTVAKEIVRLLGELRSDAAYERLIALDATPLHRDVRIAMLRALWDHLDREPTWGVFERAVSGTDHVMASRVGDIPADRLTDATDRKLSALLGRVLQRPEPEARIDLLKRAAWLSVQDVERTFLSACGARLGSRYDDEVRAAMAALLHRSDEHDMDRLEGMLAAVVGDRRALSVALEVLLALPVKQRAVYVQAAYAAERALAQEPRLASLRVRCAAAAMAPAEFAEWLVALGEAGLLNADALETCRSLVEALPEEALEPVETRLRASRSEEARRVAVWCLVRDARTGRGWTPERLTRLAMSQEDASPLVSGAAQLVFPPREMVEQGR